MTHPILAKIDEAEAMLDGLDCPLHARAAARTHLRAGRGRLAEFLDDDHAVQAHAQGVADRGMYAPLRETLAKDAAV